MKKTKIILVLLSFLCILSIPAPHVDAKELSPVIESSNGAKASSMTDDSCNTSARFSAGDTVRVTASDDSRIKAVYIKWDSPVVPYAIDTDAEILSCGANGFLHEYICFSSGTESFTINIPENDMRICGLRVFDDDQIPSDVQVWNPPCDQADILLIPSHADDEILFFGGIIPTYGAEEGAQVQVAYMTEFWSTARIREHEKLDGLWMDGLRNYPVCGNFKDVYAKDLEQAQAIYDEDAMTAYLTDTFRQFRPQVVVTHDFNGEYGHGFHKLTAKCVANALDLAADDSCRADSQAYAAYGSFDVPKAYFHLYPENSITMDLRVPLSSMDGMTALEAATESYKQHVSQQWCWFYVSDSYAYSCADFGLYRTNVGYDTTDNMLEHIKLYAQQEAERLEQERLEQERLEQERLEQERLAKEEQERLEQEKLEQERLEQERLAEEIRLAKEAEDAAKARQLTLSVVILLAVAGTIAALSLLRKKTGKTKK